MTRGNIGAPTYRVQSMRFDNVCLIVCIGGARVMVIVVIGSPAEHREHTRKHRGCHRRQKLEAQLILYRWPLVVYCFFLFFVGKNFAFHLNSLEISPSATFWTSRDHMVTSHGHRPWSQVSSLRPPNIYVPSFSSQTGFSVPTARRFSSNFANRRSRASSY